LVNLYEYFGRKMVPLAASYTTKFDEEDPNTQEDAAR